MDLQSVEYKGRTYRVIGDVTSYDGDTSIYKAEGLSDKDEECEILWETTDEWEDALLDGLVELGDDVSDACDWNNPLTVRLLQEDSHIQ